MQRVAAERSHAGLRGRFVHADAVLLCIKYQRTHARFIREQCLHTCQFRGMAFSHELGCKKPEEEFFQAMCAQFGVAPSACTFIDDHAGNVAAAEACGMRGSSSRASRRCARHCAHAESQLVGTRDPDMSPGDMSARFCAQPVFTRQCGMALAPCCFVVTGRIWYTSGL